MLNLNVGCKFTKIILKPVTIFSENGTFFQNSANCRVQQHAEMMFFKRFED